MEKYYIEMIDRYLQENKLSKDQFCKRAGISYATLKQIYKNKEKNIRLCTLLKLQKVIKCRVDDFFIRAKETKKAD